MNAVCPQCDQGFWRDEPWKRICISCFKANKRKERQREDQYRPAKNIDTALSIPPDVLKKLIYLCHPDKHKNSQMATDMFVWLSNLKK